MIASRCLGLVSVALALAIAGCGGDEEPEESTNEAGVGSIAALAQCRDWRARDESERLETIAAVREQINLEDGPVRVPELSDEQAYEVFENGCEPGYAASVRLYTLYSRAAGFSSILEP